MGENKNRKSRIEGAFNKIPTTTVVVGHQVKSCPMYPANPAQFLHAGMDQGSVRLTQTAEAKFRVA